MDHQPARESIARLDILEGVARYYREKLSAHGTTPRGVDWRDRESQQLRHQQFLRLLDTDFEASIADLGCGYGDFLSFLRPRGYGGSYSGYDVVPEMIAAAAEEHRSDRAARWTTSSEPEPADYVIASGIFNVRQDCPADQWARYVTETMDVMAAVARKGWGVNVLSSQSDPERRRADLYYADPVEWLARSIQRYGSSVALLHDYPLYEFTLLVRRRG